MFDGRCQSGGYQPCRTFTFTQTYSFWDNNNITIDGTVDLTDSTDQKTRFEASGWEVIEIDGHDPEEIDSAISAAKSLKSRQ